MKTKYLTRIYMSVSALCIIMCAVLLITVFKANEGLAIHIPPESTQVTHGDKLAVTDRYLTDGLKQFLPSNFLAQNLNVIIHKNQIILNAGLKKADVKQWLRDGGIEPTLKQSILIGLLPKNIDVEIAMEIDSEGKTISLHNATVAINGSYINMPEYINTLTVAISDGINTLLLKSGADYKSIVINDGYIELVK